MKYWILMTALCGLAACGGEPAIEIEAARETVQVGGTGDAADDPAVWLAADPAQSRILGTDKTRGLYVYDLDGEILQFLPGGRLNNVDIRPGFMAGEEGYDLAIASDRSNIGLATFLIDPASGEVSPSGVIALSDVVDPYGACLYRSPVNGDLYAFVSDKDPGRYVQLRLGWDGTQITGEELRRITLGSTAEGCVADDRTGQLYMNEENVAVWTIGAEPGAGTQAERFADVDGRFIVADAEGAALIPVGETGGWLVVSSQGDDTYAAFDLETREFAARFTLVDGVVDRVTHTDGLEIFAGSLGPDFPEGVLVVQDDEEDSGSQNFKIVDLRALRAHLPAD